MLINGSFPISSVQIYWLNVITDMAVRGLLLHCKIMTDNFFFSFLRAHYQIGCNSPSSLLSCCGDG